MRGPKHDKWRQEVVKAVVDVIARDGLAAATVRRVAAELGVSTMVISHHFSNKQEMLLWAYRIFGEGAQTRFQEIVSRDPTDLVGYLMSMNFLDASDRALWRTYVAIWDTSLREEAFRSELRSWVETGLTHIETFIRARNPDCTDARMKAARLLALIQGISVQLLFEPDMWNAGSVRRIMEAEVNAVLGPPSHGLEGDRAKS